MMTNEHMEYIRSRMAREQFDNLTNLSNPKLYEFIAEAIDLCQPDSIFLCTDEKEDIEYVRRQALERGEEAELATEGHTIHFDGYHDQARDKENTKYLLPADQDMGERINSTDRQSGLEEIREYFQGIMTGKQMIVRFFCLGPRNSVFSTYCCQITDSFYVAHSEDILYRTGYEEFKRIGESAKFFRFLHSAGQLKDNVSVDVDKRRIYIDMEENIVYSVNTQYAGNTVGLKKLALRLAINRALGEGWLAEHMFIVGAHGPNGRVTYFTGAFPSLCGKTSTAMLPGQSIIGDDIAYLRKIGGEVRAVNVESGIFGIILDVNSQDDPLIYKVLNSSGEIIFSNVLVKDGVPYWLGMGKEPPDSGYNYSGPWTPGKEDADGREITASHKNARYTVRISSLENCDPLLEDPKGAPISGIIFGGRDSNTSVPVEQSFDWNHGVITKGAALESETTAATLGKEGVRKFNPMSNLDFLAAPLGTYIEKYIEFAQDLSKPPPIFTVNYFLKGEDGSFLNGMMDKKVWLLWMEKRVNGEVGALSTPTGLIPLYEDLEQLFAQALDMDYSKEDYAEQFKIRVPELLTKVDRIEQIYRAEQGMPDIVLSTLDAQRERLEAAQSELGAYISPFELPEE